MKNRYWSHYTTAMLIVFSLLVGCGLMALLFYSSRHGYDTPPHYDTTDEQPRS